MRRSIIGAIIIATLAGCGSITLETPPDGQTERRNVVLPDSSATLPEIGLSTDAGGFESNVYDSNSAQETSPETAPQICAVGTCYRKSDPDHTTCPCHY